MAGLVVPAIHVFALTRRFKTWMPATSAGMTSRQHARRAARFPQPHRNPANRQTDEGPANDVAKEVIVCAEQPDRHRRSQGEPAEPCRETRCRRCCAVEHAEILTREADDLLRRHGRM
jgi:hypothetical protein